VPVEIPFVRDFEAPYGVIERVAPGIRRVLAPNPGPFTFKGTATFILGEGRVGVIDPGPDIPGHVEAILDGLAGEAVSHILVTHTHRDHSPSAAPLRARTGAPVHAFGPHPRVTGGDGVKVEEGGDTDFAPDVLLSDGDMVEGDGWSVEALHTPGHISNHLCYRMPGNGALFTGDHVMGWSTTVIVPPDGDMAAYVANLARLLDADDRVYWPNHGAPIRDPKPYVRALIEHRREREDQILECVRRGTGVIAEMIPAIYPGLDPRLVPAAQRSTFAAVIKLADEGRLAAQGAVSLETRYGIA
jgi:glyoxylase-like metal-dependent hydrolase (beta-lactamase superfamily II)